MKLPFPFIAMIAALTALSTTASAYPLASAASPPSRFTDLNVVDQEYLRDSPKVSITEAKVRQRFLARSADMAMRVPDTLRASVYSVSIDDVHGRLIVFVASHTEADAHPLLDSIQMEVGRWGVPLVFIHGSRVPLNPSLPTDSEPLPDVAPTPRSTASPAQIPGPGPQPDPEPLPTDAPSVPPFPSTIDHSGVEKIAPFFGGGRTSDCTTAFTAVNPNSGDKFMVTAGHCITKGSKGQVRSFGKTVIGYKGNSTYPLDGTAKGDFSLISNGAGQDYEPSVYYGLGKTIPDGMTLRVTGSDSSGMSRDAKYCINAMRSGASCGWKAVSGPTQIKYDNGGGHSTLVTGLTRVDGSNAPGIGKGDSGATVYRVDGRGAVIGGLLSGVLDDSCTINQGSDLARCSKLFVSGVELFTESFPQLEVATS